MEGLFVAVLLGCSDSATLCDEVASREIVAQTVDQCAERALASDEVGRIPYPVVIADCRPVEQPVAHLVAPGDDA